MATEFGTVFISYAERERECAEALVSWLEDCFTGFVGFFAACHLPHGDEWFLSITSAIRSCKLGLVLVTEPGVQRPWVHYEIGGLRALDKKVIPVCIGAVRIDQLPPPLEQSQACLYDDPAHRLRLLRSISQHVGLPEKFTNAIGGDKVDRAPALTPPPADLANAGIAGTPGHDLALSRLFPTKDRWTTLVYTCRATFTGETCPTIDGRGALAKALSLHVPVDELQTVCAAANHFLPAAARRHENDVLHTIICSREAEARLVSAGAPEDGVPPLADRDLILVGENNFSNLLLHLMEPFLAWAKRLSWKTRNVQKPGRPVVELELSRMQPHPVSPEQIKTVSEGGGAISIFPSPLHFRKNVLSLFGCHREGQLTLEQWLRGGQVDKVTDSVVAEIAPERLREYAIQIIVDRAGRPAGDGVIDEFVAGAIRNSADGHSFWATRINTAEPAVPMSANPLCVSRPPMFDISLIATFDDAVQRRLREAVRSRVSAPDLYWEDEECDIGFHVTLYEVCTHDLPQPAVVRELETFADALHDALLHSRRSVVPEAGRARVRGIDLASAAMISYVDFLPADKSEPNWLETVRVWTETALRACGADLKLANKRRVPYPPHVTLCRFREVPDAEARHALTAVAGETRTTPLADLPIARVVVATGTRRPYSGIDVSRAIDLG